MKYLISAAILFLTINALLYATSEVWPKVEYDRYESSLITSMETDDR
jgi:hypothetical protein